MKNSTRMWIFVTIVLSIALLTSVILGVSGVFCSAKYQQTNLEIVPGDLKSVSVMENQASSLALIFDGSLISGQKIPQKIQIVSTEIGKNLLVRAKISCDNCSGVALSTTDKFVYEDDGYYYLQEALVGGEKALFADYVQISPDANLVSGRKYIVNIVVECLSENSPVSDIW